MIVTPWVSYLLAKGMRMSGIVSILCNGLFLSRYASPNLSAVSQKSVKMAYETMAYSAEILVFIFIGMGFFAFKHPFA